MPTSPSVYLQSRLEGAHLVETYLPNTQDVRLWLLNEDYPQSQLSAEQAAALMDDPPYWAFCWASGWVVAQWVFENPSLVENRTVIDFGCGSGVAGIAALKAGARHVVFCDQDHVALAITKQNIVLNGLSADSYDTRISISNQGDKSIENNELVLVSDVFYDRENMPLLEDFLARFESVIVADSRLKGQPLQGMSIVESREASTVPDLGEAEAFKYVTIYESVPKA